MMEALGMARLYFDVAQGMGRVERGCREEA